MSLLALKKAPCRSDTGRDRRPLWRVSILAVSGGDSLVMNTPYHTQGNARKAYRELLRICQRSKIIDRWKVALNPIHRPLWLDPIYFDQS